eukprot:jgi/Mesvir1/199/Mv13548-RA.1
MQSAVLNVQALDFAWKTLDPFLFCVHHLDRFPKGDASMRPKASLAGRSLGMDFEVRDGWRMYHGRKIPGFPGHPHRGFETITVVQQGMVDHADSMGAAGRYGDGDVQWMTAGRGVQHSEMFPMLYEDRDNTLELFQIWLNLPATSKFVQPHFTMFWAEQMPIVKTHDARGHVITITVVAGNYDASVKALTPPPESWAARPENNVAIWIIKLDAGTEWVLPAAPDGNINRSLFFFDGDTISVDGTSIKTMHGVTLKPDRAVPISNVKQPSRLLLLQGRPIGEPVAQQGPFVMNSRQELAQAYADYEKTEFGGWPWPQHEMVHPKDKGRFARYGDGKEEQPPSA